MNRRTFLAAASAGLGALAGCATNSNSETTTSATTESTATTTRTTNPEQTQYGGRYRYVDSENGEPFGPGTESEPVLQLSTAVYRAEPGDIVVARPGRYRGSVRTTQAGEPDAPITITGPPDAVFEGGGKFRFDHSHVHLRGLTVDGLQNPDAPEDPESYSESLLSVNARMHEVAERQGSSLDSVDESDYVRDIVVKPHALGNCRADTLKVQYARDVDVGEFEVIGPAGVRYTKGDEDGHNSEFVYVGTPWTSKDRAPDLTRNVRVHHIDNSAGHGHAELVDCKPGTSNVTVEYCTDAGGSNTAVADDTHGGAVVIGGTDATVRWNVLSNGAQAGVEIDCDAAASDDPPPAAAGGGTNNAVYGNRLLGNDGLALRLPYRDEGQGQADQRIVCGNEYDGDTHGDPGAACSGVPDGNGVGHTGGDSRGRSHADTTLKHPDAVD